ncbi:MAG: tetratricopeptide repeat protein, partial [Gammaproteobacteria bacterium]|nr:tetratricopeptide repeat protein [Gammaproteobacteria bacterium]
KLFQDALEISPGNDALTLYYADALVTNKQPERALAALDSIKNSQPTPTYYQLRAKAEGDAHHPGAAHQMLAEYYLMYDQIGTAIEHLEKAKKQKDVTNREKESIDIRINEIKRLAEISRQL